MMSPSRTCSDTEKAREDTRAHARRAHMTPAKWGKFKIGESVALVSRDAHGDSVLICTTRKCNLQGAQQH